MIQNPINAGLSQAALITLLDAYNSAIGNMAFSSGAFAIATATTAIKSTATITYLNAGIFGSKAASDGGTGLVLVAGQTTPTNATAVQEAKFLVTIDSAGAFLITMGVWAGAGLSLLPEVPAGKSPVAYFKVSLAAGTAFVGGTTALNAAGVTTTFFNIGFVMNRFDAAQ